MGIDGAGMITRRSLFSLFTGAAAVSVTGASGARSIAEDDERIRRIAAQTVRDCLRSYAKSAIAAYDRAYLIRSEVPTDHHRTLAGDLQGPEGGEESLQLTDLHRQDVGGSL